MVSPPAMWSSSNDKLQVQWATDARAHAGTGMEPEDNGDNNNKNNNNSSIFDVTLRTGAATSDIALGNLTPTTNALFSPFRLTRGKFVAILFKMITAVSELDGSIVRWSEDGRAFFLNDLDKEKLRCVISMHFDHNNIASLRRQLFTYRFMHMKKGGHNGFWYHPEFHLSMDPTAFVSITNAKKKWSRRRPSITVAQGQNDRASERPPLHQYYRVPAVVYGQPYSNIVQDARKTKLPSSQSRNQDSCLTEEKKSSSSFAENTSHAESFVPFNNKTPSVACAAISVTPDLPELENGATSSLLQGKDDAVSLPDEFRHFAPLVSADEEMLFSGSDCTDYSSNYAIVAPSRVQAGPPSRSDYGFSPMDIDSIPSDTALNPGSKDDLFRVHSKVSLRPLPTPTSLDKLSRMFAVGINESSPSLFEFSSVQNSADPYGTCTAWSPFKAFPGGSLSVFSPVGMTAGSSPLATTSPPGATSPYGSSASAALVTAKSTSSLLHYQEIDKSCDFWIRESGWFLSPGVKKG